MQVWRMTIAQLKCLRPRWMSSVEGPGGLDRKWLRGGSLKYILYVCSRHLAEMFMCKLQVHGLQMVGTLGGRLMESSTTYEA